MNKRKVLIYGIITMVIIALIIIITNISNINSSNKNIENSITRFQWIQMLTEEFGMIEYTSDTPYYEDVNSNSEYFTSIQSAYEWGLLEESSKFKGEEPADGEFAVLTAMKAVGKYKVQIYMGLSSEPKSKDYIELAIDKELVTKSQLNKNISLEDGQAILEKASELYLSELWTRGVEEIEYQQNVIELDATDIELVNEDYSQIMLSANNTTNFNVGDPIVFSDSKTGGMIAKEIAGVNSDGRIELIDTNIENVLKSLLVSDICEVTLEDILAYNNLDEDNLISRKSNFERVSPSDYHVTPVNQVNKSLSSNGFSISLSAAEEEISIEFTDNDTGLTYEYPIDDIEEINGSINATIDVQRIYAGVQTYWTWQQGVEYVDVQLESDIKCSGEMTISKEKKIPLFKIPKYIGNGTVGVELQINLVLSVDGTIMIEASLPVRTGVVYERGAGIRRHTRNANYPESTVVADCTASCMFNFATTLKLFVWDILDLDIDVGASASAKVESRSNSPVLACADLAIALPILTVSVSAGDEIDKWIEGDYFISWEIFTAENALLKWGLHYEWYDDDTSMFVEECTYGQKEIEPIRDDYSCPIFPHYAVFDTPVEDKEYYYTASGKLYGIDESGNEFLIDSEYKFIISKGALVSVWRNAPLSDGSNSTETFATFEEYFNNPTPDYLGNIFTIDTGLDLSVSFNSLGQVDVIHADTDNSWTLHIDDENIIDADGTAWTVFGQSLMGETILKRWEEVDGWKVIEEQSEMFGFPIDDCYSTESGTYVFSGMYICKMFDSEGNGTPGQFALWFIGMYGAPYQSDAVEGVDWWRTADLTLTGTMLNY